MKYELSFIISSAIPETEHDAVKQEILGYLDKAEAKIVREPYFIGRRKLAYPIKKQKHGFYAFLEFATDKPDNLKELEVNMRHNSNILRHLIIKLDKAAESVNADPSKLVEKPLARNQGRQAAQPKKAPVRKPIVTNKPTTEAKKAEQPKPEKPGVVLEDIDKKLDDILQDTNVD